MDICEINRHLRAEDNGCLEWTGALDTNGYGNVVYAGKTWKAHRLVWVLNRGAISDGLCVLHSCDNPCCCNVEHLSLGTKRENYQQMRERGRDRKSRGQSHYHSVLSAEAVRRIREAYRYGARQIDLAAIHNTNQTNISSIVCRRSWANLE